MVLSSHVIKSDRVLNEEICKINCYLEANCASYNYGPVEDELYLCELSDKNHLQVPSDELEARYGFMYRPVIPLSKLKQRSEVNIKETCFVCLLVIDRCGLCSCLSTVEAVWSVLICAFGCFSIHNTR